MFRTKTAIVASCLFGMTVGCGAADGSAFDDQPEGAEPAEEVDQIQQASGRTVGTRPLLLILLRKDSNSLAHDTAWYTQRIFGPGFPNLNSYLTATSKSQFKYVKAGVVSVVDDKSSGFLQDSGASEVSGTNATRRRALWLAKEAGIDFSDFDTNGNGRVETKELAVLTIDNYSDTSAQNGNPGCWDHGDVEVCVDNGLAGHRAPLAMYLHELTHQFPAGHIYGEPSGSSPCLSDGMSWMSCNNGGLESSNVYYLDPWFRGRFGWIRTEFVASTAASGTARLSSVSSFTGSNVMPGYERIVLNRSGRTDESLIFEWRARTGYDGNVSRPGVVVWHVQTTTSGELKEIDSIHNAGHKDLANFTLGLPGCVGDGRKTTSRGKTETMLYGGLYRFKWLDGTDTGVVVSVVPAQENTAAVIWTRSNLAASCPPMG